MADYLTLDELSRRTGEKGERLLEWQRLGLIGAEQPEVFLDRDIGRARLIHDLLHWGLELETIANAVRDPDSIFSRFMEEIGAQHSGSVYTIQEACELAGVDLMLARRLLDAAGFEGHAEMLE